MEGHVVITQNDDSPWDDVKGDLYHFPSMYKKLIQTGINVVYYTGRAKGKTTSGRLSQEPHYFGTGIVGDIIQDPENPRNYYCEILHYREFSKPVIAKCDDGTYLETIPTNLAGNYWRYSVRKINVSDYESICGGTVSSKKQRRLPKLTSDFESTDFSEGKKKVRFSSYYERNPILRQRALEIHGLECSVCHFNFEEVYGELGKGYIHVHHNKPISESDETVIDPHNDLSVLCPNCHAMIHRRRDTTLSVEELRELINN